MRSLMAGDVWTDHIAAKWGEGTGACSACGHAEGNLLHLLWECPGPDNAWKILRDRMHTPAVQKLILAHTSPAERLCGVFAADPALENEANLRRHTRFTPPSPGGCTPQAAAGIPHGRFGPRQQRVGRRVRHPE